MINVAKLRNLFKVIESGTLDEVKALVAEYGDVYCRKGIKNANYDDAGLTPMIVAAAEGRDDVMRFLVEKGAPVDERIMTSFFSFDAGEESVYSPLIVAVALGRLDAVKFLVENGADLFQTVNIFSISLMHLAYLNGHMDVAAYLEKQGLKFEEFISQDDNYGMPLLNLLISLGIKKHIVLDLVNNKGFDIDASEPETGRKPIHSVAFGGSLKLAQLFTEEFGADIFEPAVHQEKKLTPIQIAAKEKNFELVRYFAKRGANISEVLELDGESLFAKTNAITNRPDDKGKLGPSDANRDEANTESSNSISLDASSDLSSDSSSDLSSDSSSDSNSDFSPNDEGLYTLDEDALFQFMTVPKKYDKHLLLPWIQKHQSLFHMIGRREFDKATALIESDEDIAINASYDNGYTLLHQAVQAADNSDADPKPLIALLIKRGADKNIRNREGSLAANLSNDAAILKTLLSKLELALGTLLFSRKNLLGVVQDVMSGLAKLESSQSIETLDIMAPSTEDKKVLITQDNCQNILIKYINEYLLSFLVADEFADVETVDRLKKLIQMSEIDAVSVEDYDLIPRTLSDEEFSELSLLMKNLPAIIRAEISPQMRQERQKELDTSIDSKDESHDRYSEHASKSPLTTSAQGSLFNASKSGKEDELSKNEPKAPKKRLS